MFDNFVGLNCTILNMKMKELFITKICVLLGLILLLSCSNGGDDTSPYDEPQKQFDVNLLPGNWILVEDGVERSEGVYFSSQTLSGNSSTKKVVFWIRDIEGQTYNKKTINWKLSETGEILISSGYYISKLTRNDLTLIRNIDLYSSEELTFIRSNEDNLQYYEDLPEQGTYHGDLYRDAFVPNGFNRGHLISIATTLKGQWKGTINTEYVDDYWNTQKGTYGADFQFDQYKTNSINGRGREINYKLSSDSEEIYRMPYSWYIDSKTEDIYMKYDDGREMHVSSYHLDDNSFYGTMKSTDGSEVDEFNLTR